MRGTFLAFVLAVATLTSPAALRSGQGGGESNDYHALLQQGKEALARNQFADAARAFQRAVDLNPSSGKAHEGLGVALFRQLAAENVRPSAYSDVLDRAQSHLEQACQLSPSAPGPLLELSDLEAYLAKNSFDAEERTGYYRKAQDSLKQVLSLQPSEPDIYLRLANLERDEFGPVLQQAKARYATSAGPISDANVRQDLHNRYIALIDDAITNARRASEMNGTAQQPLLLLWRLFRERALIRDTQEQYASDMQSARDWRRQFLSVGGHVESADDGNR